MIEVKNVSFGYPQKDLYENITFTIEDNAHCAFIGSNGTGKSTLIDMILHEDKYLYDGIITKKQDCRTGYVSQFSDVDRDSTMTVFDYLSTEFVTLQQEMDDICAKMSDAEDFDAVMAQYQDILDAIDRVDGNNYEVNIKKTLKVAGLENRADIGINQLSGGEFKLIQVMREMLIVPDFLVMDEPDVFLDFANLNALKELINTYKGTLLVITHNRYLLNHCFDTILHLENSQLQQFVGTYPEYQLYLLKMKAQLQEAAAADTEEIERNQKIVEQLRKDATYFSNAAIGRQLHARVSLVERLEAKRVLPPFLEEKAPQIAFHTGKESEMDVVPQDEDMQVLQEQENNIDNILTNVECPVLEVTDYALSFGEDLLQQVSFTIGATDKVAIVGANGTGKTTLLHEIYAGKNPAIHYAQGARVAYLSQLPDEMLQDNQTVADVLEEIGIELKEEQCNYLDTFCLPADIRKQKVSTLSGGEKNLLQLAKLARTEMDLLLLDEPNSHLDLYAQKALEEAVREYRGAVLCVSHDFYTVANCMDYVLFVDNHTVRKMSIRKFRQMIYANYFDKEYLIQEQTRKEAERAVEQALLENDFQKANALLEKLEA